MATRKETGSGATSDPPAGSGKPAQYVIGIDLGTTNCALAYVPLGEESATAQILPIPQLVGASTVESRDLLPSFLYLGTEAETSASSLDLPWKKKATLAVGELARRQAAEVPTRTVAGAKSWLCHGAVDRQQPILPWNAPADVPKLSPVAASAKFLAHLVAAWKAAFPKAPLDQQQVVLTVPASFDPSARDLTREAALLAGLPADLVLLEEPQAALYAWLADSGDRWRKQLKVGDTLLVCDVGGGTTDLTLIGVAEEAGELGLHRIAVGNHILVGGDNMDLTLAHAASGAFAQKGVPLDPWQSVALWHSCRLAKEQVLSESGASKHPVTVLGRGSRLIKGTVSVDLERESALSLLLEGFFPPCEPSARPARRAASGFRELGLPFETDTAITRHLAGFLSGQAAAGGGPARPTHVLFNGGVFKASAFRDRLLQVLASWFPGQAPAALAGTHDLDHAVARGAVHYGLARLGRGIRIRGGAARSYYVGIETSGPAIPGAPRPLRALCVVPRGMEEGTELDVPWADVALIVGEPAQFRFFSSAVRQQDQPGDCLAVWAADELTETAPLEAHLDADQDAGPGYVPVHFHSRITELGMFELWCVTSGADRQWKLEFSVREETL